MAEQQLNVFGDPIEECGFEPMTGFFRDGMCHTDDNDLGSHTVCVNVTETFLKFSYSKGNDLITPMPEYGFPGLMPGDRWCLCAERWNEAYKENAAPNVILKATNIKALDVIPIQILKQHAIDLL